MKYLHYTLAGGKHGRNIIWDYKTAPKWVHEDYGIVAAVPKGDHNSLRFAIATLWRYASIHDMYDMLIAEDGNRLLLLTYIRNWPSRAGYYAGMIHVRQRQRRSRKMVWL